MIRKHFIIYEVAHKTLYGTKSIHINLKKNKVGYIRKL